ncbi:MAG: metalloenzyme domain-containing protein [Fidelibacterota bacterium]
MKFLFLFLDGVGLGTDDPSVNPLVEARMPTLRRILGGKPLTARTAGSGPLEVDGATLWSIDARLGVKGRPQSATGQATLVSGINVPELLGRHHGPKPNGDIARILNEHNLFSAFTGNGAAAGFLNAFPPRYFDAIGSGLRLPGTLALAVTSAGLDLKTADDLLEGRALSADFTGQGWREDLGFPQVDLLMPYEAGRRLAGLARGYDFSLFEVWLTDYAGHRRDMKAACAILETIDGVLDGLLESWNIEEDLIFITSDHGNMEDLTTRSHTSHPVPALMIGPSQLRSRFSRGLKDLSDIAPRILSLYDLPETRNEKRRPE